MTRPRVQGKSASKSAGKASTGKASTGKASTGKVSKGKSAKIKPAPEISSPGRPAPGETARKAGGKPAVSDGHGLKVHVRTARKRSHSSTLWLERQLNDPYVARARSEGYRSRAAFKLLEIDERFKLLKPGMIVVDLGAAPGSWAQIAARKVKSIDRTAPGAGRVIAIDVLEMEPLTGVECAVMDFTDADAPERLRAMLAAGAAETPPVHGVMSDMAANTTGHRKTDHLRIVHLAELAAEFAGEVLAPGGFFLAKMFQGGTEGDLLAALKRDYATVRHIKPKASRADSAELYVLATGFRGRRA